MSKELELLDELRGYLDIKLSGKWARYMLHAWFSPGVIGYMFVYSRRTTYGVVRLGEEKGLASYKCVVQGNTLLEALENLKQFVKDNGYEKYLIHDANTHFEGEEL